MSFLNLKKKSEKKSEPSAPRKVTVSSDVRISPDVIVRPHITEKASASATVNAYVFEVSERANKQTIREAIKVLYKVIPVKIAIVPIPGKRIVVKGKKGIRKGGKKAYVYLKEGDKLEIV